jgi:hypothetical protein
MGLFDFLMSESTEKASPQKYAARVSIDGKMFPVTTLGIGSVIIGAGGDFRTGQKVVFDLSLKDPKENLALKGNGVVATVDKSQTKITYVLPEQQKLAVARFLARYMTR